MHPLTRDRAFDVIIVLGAAQRKDGSPGPAMVRRMNFALELMAQGVAPVLLLSGGPTSTDVAEAETMRQMALSQNLTDRQLLCELKSTTTLENAENCAALLKHHKRHRCLLVTDHFHMPRAIATFRAFGVDPEAAPVTVPLTGPGCVFYLRERLARLVYPWRIKKHLRAGRTITQLDFNKEQNPHG